MLIKKIEKYYNKNKEKSLYFYPLAVLYYKKNEKEKAYQLLLDGLQHYPRYVLALTKIAEILIEEDKYKAALAYLETSASIQKYNEKVMRYLALSYEKVGKYSNAVEMYEKILEAYPKDEKSRSKIVELAPMLQPAADSIDSLMDDLGEKTGIETVDKQELLDSAAVPNGEEENETMDIAIDEIPKIDLDNDEDVPYDENKNGEEISVTLAKLYEKQGYINDAVGMYEKLLQKEPDNLEVRASLSRLKNMENDNEKAD